MKLKLYQVDAFTDKIFKGNPAAVVPLEEWLPDEILQNIALENSLPETAFFVKEGDCFHLRWFTMAREVDLCGHATLAAAYVLFYVLNYAKEEIRFSTKSGMLIVKKDGDRLIMDLPVINSNRINIDDKFNWSLDFKPLEILTSKQDLIVVLSSEADVKSFDPDWKKVDFMGHRGLIATARGKDVDFVSRCFYPELSVEEDPVTGSAHCQLAPYWSKILKKNKLDAKQASKRGGNLTCEIKNDRVSIAGTVVLFLKGEINFS